MQKKNSMTPWSCNTWQLAKKISGYLIYFRPWLTIPWTEKQRSLGIWSNWYQSNFLIQFAKSKKIKFWVLIRIKIKNSSLWSMPKVLHWFLERFMIFLCHHLIIYFYPFGKFLFFLLIYFENRMRKLTLVKIRKLTSHES